MQEKVPEKKEKTYKKKILIAVVSIVAIALVLIVYFNSYSCKATNQDFLVNTEINNEYIEFYIRPYTDIKEFSVTLKAHTGLVTLYGWEKDVYLGNVEKNKPIILRYTYSEVFEESGNKTIRYLSVDNINGKIKKIHQNHKYKKFGNNECQVVVTYDGIKGSITCTFTNLTNKQIKKINNICFKTDFNGKCEIEVSAGKVAFNNGLNPGETETVQITDANIHKTIIEQVFVDANVDIQYYVIYAE